MRCFFLGQQSAPELIASMGLGADEDTSGSLISLDDVERLRPLLRIKEDKGQRLMQNVIQKQMKDMMGGSGESGPQGAQV